MGAHLPMMGRCAVTLITQCASANACANLCICALLSQQLATRKGVAVATRQEPALHGGTEQYLGIHTCTRHHGLSASHFSILACRGITPETCESERPERRRVIESCMLIKTEDAAERDRGVSARFPPVVPVPHAGTRVKRRDQRGEKAPKARAG